jgi:hypothetical protein
MKELTRVTADPQVMGGKPCIRGLRVTVGTVVGLVAAGRSRKRFSISIHTLKKRILPRRLPIPLGALRRSKCRLSKREHRHRHESFAALGAYA